MEASLSSLLQAMGLDGEKDGLILASAAGVTKASHFRTVPRVDIERGLKSENCGMVAGDIGLVLAGVDWYLGWRAQGTTREAFDDFFTAERFETFLDTHGSNSAPLASTTMEIGSNSAQHWTLQDSDHLESALVDHGRRCVEYAGWEEEPVSHSNHADEEPICRVDPYADCLDDVNGSGQLNSRSQRSRRRGRGRSRVGRSRSRSRHRTADSVLAKIEHRLLEVVDAQPNGRIDTNAACDAYPQRDLQCDLQCLGLTLKEAVSRIPSIQRFQGPQRSNGTTVNWFLKRATPTYSNTSRTAAITTAAAVTASTRPPARATFDETTSDQDPDSSGLSDELLALLLSDAIVVETKEELEELAGVNPLFQDPWDAAALAPQADLSFFENGAFLEDGHGSDQDDGVVAIDFQGSVARTADDDSSAQLHLVLIATSTKCLVLDCTRLGEMLVGRVLSPLLRNAKVLKLVHQGHLLASILSNRGGISTASSFLGWMDSELIVEAMTMKAPLSSPSSSSHQRRIQTNFSDLHQYFTASTIGNRRGAGRGHGHPRQNRWVRQDASSQSSNFHDKRPSSRIALALAVERATQLRDLWDDDLHERSLENIEDATAIQRASDTRMQHAAMAADSSVLGGCSRHICFDEAHSFTMTSMELLRELRPGDVLQSEPLVVSNETSTLLNMLPEDLMNDLQDLTEQLSDIVLDKGRRPHAWVGGERIFLGGKDRLVDSTEIMDIVLNLGGFGTDNRAGLEKQLHRISAVRNRNDETIGLTMRVGRHVTGNATMIADLLYTESTKSILFLGGPGSGKTTVVREVTRLLSDTCNVCIVDTSNEIAGDGDVPHPCVGHARRLMVQSLDRQGAVMIECVQNHTPSVMVIDEIGRQTEVEAARTCKNRGVRLIASAHGDLRRLVKNPKLRGLIGGVESVTLGDVQAKLEARRHNASGISKTKTERAGPPTFDIIVELSRGEHHSWRVVRDTARAVDCILDGQSYRVERRFRNPQTGGIQIAFEEA